jgi:hypothetical protein
MHAGQAGQAMQAGKKFTGLRLALMRTSGALFGLWVGICLHTSLLYCIYVIWFVMMFVGFG